MPKFCATLFGGGGGEDPRASVSVLIPRRKGFKKIYSCLAHSRYILLHDWEGNTGEYSVRGWQYWPERSEGQYRSRELNIPPYCLTQRSAVIDLLYDLHTVLLVVHAQGSSL